MQFNNKFYFFLIFIILFDSFSLLSQDLDEYRKEYLNSSNGLQNNFISKIITDSYGLKWFGTEGGMIRYDGLDFKIYRPTTEKNREQLLNENIETLFCDSLGEIWVGTKSGGLSSYNPITDEFTNYNYLINKNKEKTIRITGILEDNQHNIWVTTWNNGVFSFDLRSKEIKNHFSNTNKLKGIAKDKFGDVWWISSTSISRYDHIEQCTTSQKLPLAGAMCLFYDKTANTFLIGGGEGLYEFSPKSKKGFLFKKISDSSIKRVQSIYMDIDRRIWVGSWTEGLHLISNDQKTIKKIPLNYDCSNSNFETILDIQIDKNGTIWLGTGQGGVIKLVPSKGIKYSNENCGIRNGVLNNDILSVITDRNNGVWCGTLREGVKYSSDGKKFSNLSDQLSLKTSCFIELGNEMLVGTKNGIFFFNTDNLSKGISKHILKKHKITSIYLDSSNQLWIGTQMKGLFVYDYMRDGSLKFNTSYTSYQKETGLDSNRITTILEDSQRKIWIGTYNGIYCYNDQESKFIRKDTTIKNEIPSVIILSMFINSKNELLIGTSGGLLKLNHTNGQLKVIQKYGPSNGLKNEYITAVTEDASHNIWITNLAGISMIKQGSDVITNLNYKGNNFYSMNKRSCHNTGKIIYFGSSNGLFTIDPEKVNVSKNTPDILITNLKINNKEVGIRKEVNGRILLNKNIISTDQLLLTYKERIINLNFVPTVFTNEYSLNYHYRIKGFQNSWVNNGNDKNINLIGLKPGKYIIQIKSSRDNITFGNTKSISIEILPPLWQSNFALFFYFLVFSTVVVFISRILINRARLKESLKIERLNKTLDKELYNAKIAFYTNVSHEIRTPLTLIITPLADILASSNIEKGVKTNLQYVQKNAQRLLSLVNQLLDFRKAELGLLKLQVSSANFVNFAKEVFISYKGFAQTKLIDYNFKTTRSVIPLTFDHQKMEVVLNNLLSNAFKFSPNNGKIVMSLSINDSFCEISIEDSGPGIPLKYQDKVFDRFFQVSDQKLGISYGSGIGLSLCKKIVNLHNGDVSFESKVSKGTIFKIQLPLDEKNYLIDDFLIDDTTNKSLNKSLANELSTLNDKEKEKNASQNLLVVDDNEDIRRYITSVFDQSFNVITASDGHSAIEIVENSEIHLIISDLMMPKMSGLQLCETLKSQISTSHIPIILLTGKTSKTNEEYGLKIGADAYVKKPFDVNILKSKVVSLLENRQRIKKHIKNSLRFDVPEDLELIDIEEVFIKKTQQIVEENFMDPNFSVQTLASELNMSQSSLYRKLKSVTGMSIAGFIRSVRLKKSTNLLLNTDLKLNEIGYAVGFNDYKYFKRSFIDLYGMSPMEFRKNKLK